MIPETQREHTEAAQALVGSKTISEMGEGAYNPHEYTLTALNFVLGDRSLNYAAQEALFFPPAEGQVFARNDFAAGGLRGGVYSAKKVARLAQRTSSPGNQILWAKQRKLQAEVRCLYWHGLVSCCTCSPKSNRGQAFEPGAEIRAMIRDYYRYRDSGDERFIIDFAMVGGRWYALELNPVECSEFYGDIELEKL